MNNIEEERNRYNKIYCQYNKLYHEIAIKSEFTDTTLWIFYSLYKSKSPLNQNDLVCYIFYFFHIYIIKVSMWGGNVVRSHIEERAIVVAKYILEKNTTVRQTAKTFGVSKSTIHKDVTERLEEINPTLAKEVKMVLEKNKSERHIRGGMATKLKYEKETQKDVG